MARYDPLVSPAPEEWLDMDEAERIALVKDFHRRSRIRPPDLKTHVALHVIIETQLAMADGNPVVRTLERLMADGLDRHEAVHAIALVLAEHIMDVANGRVGLGGQNAAYYAALERLTVESWRNS